MNPQQILVEKVIQVSEAYKNGEISEAEANRVIAIYAETLRVMNS